MASHWKEALEGQIPEDRREDIETFAGQVELRKQNKVDEKVFAETRLRWGIYGQRYDNGQRYDPNCWALFRAGSVSHTKWRVLSLRKLQERFRKV